MATSTITHSGQREYVRSAELAEEIREWIGTDDPERNYHELARLAKVSPRSVSKILRGETRFTPVMTADRMLTAAGSHLVHVDTVWRTPGGDCK